MTTKWKIRLLNIAGALISFIAPALATVIEFPRVQRATLGDGGLLGILNLSTAAFAIIVLLFAISCWRFLKNHFKLPESGLGLSLVLFAICYGVELIIHSFVVILGWSVIGCAAALVFYKIADKLDDDKEKEK